jgi:hypothetical protein
MKNGITKYYEGVSDTVHTEDQCDKCGKDVGKKNLKALQFIYCDVNDKFHPDVSEIYGFPRGAGYRLYECCEDCYDKA